MGLVLALDLLVLRGLHQNDLLKDEASELIVEQQVVLRELHQKNRLKEWAEVQVPRHELV